MTVTAYVTRDIGRTFGVTHGPITRSDPIRSDPALLQLHRWSPSHHGVQKVDASDSAPVVAPSPVTTPDAMMSLTAIEHLDFEPDWHCESARHHSGRSHGGPGWALVTQSCPACAGHSTQGVICRSWWDAKCRSKARCDLCGHISTMADFVRIAAVLA